MHRDGAAYAEARFAPAYHTGLGLTQDEVVAAAVRGFERGEKTYGVRWGLIICAMRHIHMTPEDANVFGVKDRDIVEVAVGSGERSLTFGNVLIRVSPKYKLEMHIDTDEGNAAEINTGEEGVLQETSGSGTLRKRRVVAG